MTDAEKIAFLENLVRDFLDRAHSIQVMPPLQVLEAQWDFYRFAVKPPEGQ